MKVLPPAVTVSYSAASYTATEGGTAATVTVTLSADPERSVTIPISGKAQDSTTAQGTTGADYSGVPASVTITSGSTSATFTVTAVDDAADDDGESVALSFGTLPSRVTAGSQATATVNLIDNDVPEVTVSYSSASYSATEGGTAATVQVNLSAQPERSVTIPVSASGSDGATSADYTLSTRSVTFSSTQTSRTFTVTATDDTVDDDGESVALSFGNLPTRVTAGNPATETVSLIDNDVPEVTVSYSSASYSATESGSAATVTVNLSAQPERSVTIPVRASGSGGATSADYTLSTRSVTFSSTQTSRTFTVTATDDTVDDDGERVALSFGRLPTRVTAGNTSTSTVSLDDNDASPTVTLSLSSDSIGENGGSTAVAASLNHASSAATTVTVAATAISPAVPGDFTLSPNKTLTIAAGATASTGTVSVTANDNRVDAPDKTVTVAATVSNTQGIAGDPADKSLTITDDDTRGVTVSKSAVEVTEASGSGNTATYTMVLNSEPTATVTVTPTSGDTTVVTVSGALEFTASNWDKPQTVTVTGVDNTVDNATNLTASMTHTVAGGDYATVTANAVSATLIDDESSPTVTLTLTPSTIAENGGTSAVTASLSHPSSAATTVTVSAAGPSGSYTLTGDTLTIAAGKTASTGTVTVAAVDDAVDDPDKTVIVSGISANAQGVTGPLANTLTIEDDDVSVSYSAAAYTATEGGTSATVTVNLSEEPEKPVTIPIVSAAQNGATAQGVTGADYSGIPANVTIASGSTSAAFTVMAADDAIDDDGEGVSLTFGELPEGFSRGSPATATVSIADAA